jgi:hypothetical protein
MSVFYREDLDALQCTQPGCTHDSPEHKLIPPVVQAG